ncbi:MAG: hypothetical protein IPQ23_09935 [Cytophagaceae bacterium]|nr:hypothetical protein [Cytophagaceae bacterium]
MRVLKTLLFLILFSQKLLAQFSSIGLPYPSGACINTQYQVTVYISGFTNGTTVSVLLSNDDFSTSTTIGSATYNGEYSLPVNCLIPNGLTQGDNYKVKASAPGVPEVNNYASGNFSIATSVPSASMTGTLGFNACNGNINLPIIISGFGPFEYTYQRTGDAYQIIRSNILSNSPVETVSSAGTYVLQAVGNACGAGTVAASPNNTAVVSAIAPVLTIGTPSDDKVCMGGKIKVPFTSNQSCFSYTVQISDNTGSNFQDITTEYDSFGDPNNLVATIPQYISPAGAGYKLRVKTSTFNGDYFSAASVATLTLIKKPEISSVSYLNLIDNNYPGVIAKGENIKINVKFEGTPDYLLNINDEIFASSVDSIVFSAAPVIDTRYTYGPLQDQNGCFSNNNYTSDLEVKDYIFKLRIEENNNLDIYSQFRNFCKNEYIHLYYMTRTVQSPDSVYVQVAYRDDLLNGIENWVNATFEKEADHMYRVKMPSGLRKGRYSLRLIPRNPSHTFLNYAYSQINDATTPSTDFILMDPVSGEITGDEQIYISPNEAFNIYYKFSGGPDYYDLGSVLAYKPTLITSTGQTIEYNNYNPNGNGFSTLTGQSRVDTVSQTMYYRLGNVMASTAAAGNISCVLQASTYRDTLKVNVVAPDPLRSISTGIINNATDLCGGATIVVPFTHTGTFNPGNLFIVQLQAYNNTFDNKPFSNFFTVPTTPGLNPGELIATLPKELERYLYTYYKVRVISTNSMVLGSSSSTWVSVSPRPPLVKLSGTAYVEAGQNAKVLISTNNYPGFNFTLNNSSGYTSPSINSNIYSLTSYTPFSVETPPAATPGTTLTYNANISPNSCGAGTQTGAGYVNIVASPAITLNTPELSQNCTPQKLSIPFSSTFSFADENTFSAQVWHTYYGYSAYVSSVTIKKIGEKFQIEFPSTSVPQANTTFYVKVYSSQPYAYSNVQSFTLHPSPSYSFLPFQQKVEQGQSVNLEYYFYGNSPFDYKIIMPDNDITGNTVSTSAIYSVTPQQSFNYRLKSMNDVFCPAIALNSGPDITLIEKKQGIEILKLPFSGICGGSSITVPFISNGSYDSFVIQLSDQDGQNFVDLSTTLSSGNLLATVPNGLPAGINYRIRIKGNLTGGGQTFSLVNPFALTLKSTATATLGGGGVIVKNVNFPGYVSDYVALRVDFSGQGPYTFNLNDGVVNNPVNTNSNPHFIMVNPASTTTYTINSLTNSCGSGSNSGSAIVNVVNLQAGSVPVYLCYGQTLNIPVTFTGNFDPLSQYYVDFIKVIPYNNTINFSSNYETLLGTKSGNNISVVIPNGFPTTSGINGYGLDSYYRIRVRSTLPVATGSFSPIGLGIGGGAPTVKILGSTNITTPGTSTPLTLVLSSVSGTTDVTINNGTSTEVWTAGALETTVLRAPTLTTTYTITAIASECGAGTIGNPASATITVGPCPANQMVSLNHISGQTKKYETSGILTAMNKISSGANITFDAQHAVILSPGFTANSGSVFKVQVDGCGGL